MTTKSDLTQEPILIRQGSKIKLPYTYDYLVKNARGTNVEQDILALEEKIKEANSVSKLVYMTSDFNLVKDKPSGDWSTEQIWIDNPTWGQFHTFTTFQYADFFEEVFKVIPGVKFSARFSVRATSMQQNVGFKVRMIDKSTGEVLGENYTVVNLTNDDLTSTPINIESTYHVEKEVKFSDLTVELQIKTTSGSIGITILSTVERPAYLSAYQPGGAITPSFEIGTVEVGDVASVTNVGTENHVILNFVLPQVGNETMQNLVTDVDDLKELIRNDYVPAKTTALQILGEEE